MRLDRYTASWCMPCKSFAPVAEKVCEKLDVPVNVIDVSDDMPDGMLGVPTIKLYDEMDQLIAEHTGAMNAKQLEDWLVDNGC